MANEPAWISRSSHGRFLAALVLVFLGSLMLAGWEGWFRYSQYSADKYRIVLTLEDGRTLELKDGLRLRVLKTAHWVSVENADDSERTIFFNPREVSIQPRKPRARAEEACLSRVFHYFATGFPGLLLPAVCAGS